MPQRVSGRFEALRARRGENAPAKIAAGARRALAVERDAVDRGSSAVSARLVSVSPGRTYHFLEKPLPRRTSKEIAGRDEWRWVTGRVERSVEVIFPNAGPVRIDYGSMFAERQDYSGYFAQLSWKGQPRARRENLARLDKTRLRDLATERVVAQLSLDSGLPLEVVAKVILDNRPRR
jgi:hypothetical protein